MPSPEEQERRIDKGVEECKAGPLAHFTLGFMRSRGQNESGPQTVVTHIYSKDPDMLQLIAKAVLHIGDGHWKLAELSTPSGLLCRTYRPEVK